MQLLQQNFYPSASKELPQEKPPQARPVRPDTRIWLKALKWTLYCVHSYGVRVLTCFRETQPYATKWVSCKLIFAPKIWHGLKGILLSKMVMCMHLPGLEIFTFSIPIFYMMITHPAVCHFKKKKQQILPEVGALPVFPKYTQLYVYFHLRFM